MKRKPMLFQKLEGTGQGRVRDVIGLIGTHRGVGVTHTALMLAFYMGEELGRKTALLECNNHRDLELVQEAYEWSRNEAHSFSFHKITCYKEVLPERIPDIYGEGFECLILDFGDDFQKSREEFLRCTTKIVIGGAAEWELLKLHRFVQNAEIHRGCDSWLYFIPQASDRKVIRFSKEISRKVWSVPHVEEPTMPSRISYRFFNHLF